jgi:tRNA pseudouridine13 synthase
MILKHIPEDFLVNEVLSLKIEEGPFFYYKITKKNWNTLDLIREIAQRLKVKDVGFAGLKDRNAITTQYISVKRKISFSIKDVSFDFVGTGQKRIYLGMLKGNKFTLTLRDLDKKIEPITSFVNLFGQQRFSTNNVEIGRNLVKGDFREVCSILDLPVEKNDCIGALRMFGVKKLKLFLRAYQSFLWNTLAQESKKEELPILGYLTDDDDYANLMEKEGITKKSFMMRSFPEIGCEGTVRTRVVDVNEFKIVTFEEDDLFEGKFKQVVSFYLPKGSYATVFIDNLVTKGI